MLNYADPAVDVQLLESGEHIIAACGEVHLEVRAAATNVAFVFRCVYVAQVLWLLRRVLVV
jgi:translation elongation factor EF-G